MSIQDDIDFFTDAIAWIIEQVKSKNDIGGTYVPANDAPRFGWGIDGTRLGTISEGAIGTEDPALSRGIYWYIVKNLDDEAMADLVVPAAALASSTHAKHIHARINWLAWRLNKILGVT